MSAQYLSVVSLVYMGRLILKLCPFSSTVLAVIYEVAVKIKSWELGLLDTPTCILSIKRISSTRLKFKAVCTELVTYK